MGKNGKERDHPLRLKLLSPEGGTKVSQSRAGRIFYTAATERGKITKSMTV